MDVASVPALDVSARPAVKRQAAAPVQAQAEVNVNTPSPAAQSVPSSPNGVEKGNNAAIQTPLEDTLEKVEKEHGAIPKDSLDKAIDQINKSLVNFNRHMEINVHDKLNRIMVKVVDTEQDKVIREIPPEKVLDAFAKALEMAGVLVDEKR